MRRMIRALRGRAEEQGEATPEAAEPRLNEPRLEFPAPEGELSEGEEVDEPVLDRPVPDDLIPDEPLLEQPAPEAESAEAAGGEDPQQPARLRRRVPSLWEKRLRRLAPLAAAVMLLVVLPYLATHTDRGGRLLEQSREQMLSSSMHMGFRVTDISVEGRRRTPPEELLNALDVRRGDAILGIDLNATRQRLEEISWVRSARLERRLPGELRLVITERDPIAVWQNQGRYFLVDREGLVVGDQIEAFPDLPLVVGEGAPDHVAGLLGLLRGEPELMGRVKAAQWISGRRWNLKFDSAADGIDLRLPEEDAETAWHELARLESGQKILERKIALIDMRLPDRIVLRATGGAEETLAAHANAKKKSQPGKDA